MSTDQPEDEISLLPLLPRARTTANGTGVTMAHNPSSQVTPSYVTLRKKLVPQALKHMQQSNLQPKSRLRSESDLLSTDTSHMETTVDNFNQTSFPEAPLPGAHCYGKPKSKPLISILYVGAIVVTRLALISTLLTVSPSYHWAAKLEYTNQIIIIDFLLSLMSYNSQRFVSHPLILLEVRFGPSTLQNLDGILRWSPYAHNFGFTRRLSIAASLALPLGLSVLYKRFTGGLGSLPCQVDGSLFAPTGPPGLQNVGQLGIMANATIPFVAGSSDTTPFPDFSDGPKAYGFNTLLLSNTSAAALDGPFPNDVAKIQLSLKHGDVATLNANVRATVANYNSTTETHRTDSSFWDKCFPPENSGSLG